MASLYVASTEMFAGKSAVCIGVLDRARRDGHTIGYMKPVATRLRPTDDDMRDADAEFIVAQFQLNHPLDRVVPVHYTRSMAERVLREQFPEGARRLREAFAAISRDCDLVVLEGTDTPEEGALLDLAMEQVVEALDAPVLLVVRYKELRALDAILLLQQRLGDRLLGVLLNQVEPTQQDHVRQRLTPFLEGRGIAVFGVLADDAGLAQTTVADMHTYLGGQYIGSAAWKMRSVASLSVGAMGVEHARIYFARNDQQAVITGGDRDDLQLAALETSTALLILTGNTRPSPQVIDRAEAAGVPIICVPDDTLSTVDRASRIFGNVRITQRDQMEHIARLLDASVDFDRLYDMLGLVHNDTRFWSTEKE